MGVRVKRMVYRILGIAFGVLILLLGMVLMLFYWRHDAIVQEILKKANEDFKGKVTIGYTSISFVEDFPLVDVDLHQVQVWERKNDSLPPILHIQDVYIGFDIATILSGNMEIKKLHVEDGQINIVQYPNGDLNLALAFEPIHPVESIQEEFHFDLQAIQDRKSVV